MKKTILFAVSIIAIFQLKFSFAGDPMCHGRFLNPITEEPLAKLIKLNIF